MIVGIDEVGRGAWAGPLCVGAVVLGGAEIDGLTDSKLLTIAHREELSLRVRQVARGVGLGWVSARQIDEHGLGPALRAAAAQAISHIDLTDVESIVIDGTIPLIKDPRATTMKKADLLVPSVSAASVVAKVARDHYMYHIHRLFPHYGFDTHVGYGTQRHRQALDQHGPSPIHRMSFAPLVVRAANPTEPGQTIGGLAEQAAAEHLQRQGYRIVERNWKTKWCEIDIIAERDKAVYFVEVKYRSSDRQGTGLHYITPRKVRQMRFAAELWLTSHEANTCRLAALAVSGVEMSVGELVVV